MTYRENNRFEVAVMRQLGFWIGVGMVWFAAWCFNPNIDSGTVWFVAVLFGVLYGNLSVLDQYGARKS